MHYTHRVHDLAPLACAPAARKLLDQQEFQVRRQWRHLTKVGGAHESAPPVEPAAALEVLANTLEFALAWAAITEAVRELPIRNVADLKAHFADISRIASSRAGIDIQAVIDRSEAQWRVAQAPPDDQAVTTDIEDALRAVRSLLLHVQIDPVEQFARSLQLAEVAHRCRMAYESLGAFVQRNSPATQATERVVGRAYAEGRVSLGEAATLLGTSPTDAVAFLESRGFCRSAEAVALSPAERLQMLGEIRAERLSRSGRPAARADLVARDVIASQRIEGIDARQWLRRGE
jgi:hypothetical protein